jgi:hypothetical protein
MVVFVFMLCPQNAHVNATASMIFTLFFISNIFPCVPVSRCKAFSYTMSIRRDIRIHCSLTDHSKLKPPMFSTIPIHHIHLRTNPDGPCVITGIFTISDTQSAGISPVNFGPEELILFPFLQIRISGMNDTTE